MCLDNKRKSGMILTGISPTEFGGEQGGNT
jgi:hypothetical protein